MTRRASAGTRRRRRKYLTWNLRQVAPGARTVRVTPACTGGPAARHGWAFVVLALDERGQAIPLQPSVRGGERVSGHSLVADLLQAAFPNARWDRTHTWKADRPDELTEYTPTVLKETAR